MLVAIAPASAQIDPSSLRPVGYHPGPIAYYTAPYFANAFHQSGEWYGFSGGEFGTPADFNNSQFENGYPKFLQPGQKLRAPLFGLNIDDPFRPAGWPSHAKPARGRIVVTWKGEADIQLQRCPFLASGSSGSATGNLANGRRIYDCAASDASMQSLEVHSIAAPLTEIRVWFPRPGDPNASLEGELFHPLLLQRIGDAAWSFIRFMDWGATNASPLQDWADRRVPAHAFMNGVINARPPAPSSDGNRETGAAYEHMIALCNATGRDLWINVPHLASDDFIMKLARLIRFGSDGVNPYDAPQTSPRYAPLRSDLRVWVEYSNEIWSSGFSFPQGDWAEDQAARAGLTRPRFNARRFADVWRIFQQVFGGRERLVRVAAIFTANDAYSRPFLEELAAYGPALNPSVRPDVLALTTYFGNGIQQFVHDRKFAEGKLYNDPYWSSTAFASDLTTSFEEWKRRMLAGDSVSGTGPDATGIGGGFPASLRTLTTESLGYALPLIAYEGGPSLFTDDLDGGATNSDGVPADDGVTTFVEAMNRDARIAEVYRMHLEIAKSKGLWTHTPYTDAAPWGKFGQWGHLETFDQQPASAPKYALMLEHFERYTQLRHIDTPSGAVPSFTTAAILPPAIVRQSYSAGIETTGGDAARTAVVTGSYLDSRLNVSTPSAGTIRISGVPSVSRKNFILARVNDAGGDPAWRIFTLEAFGGPGTLVQSDFRGTAPAFSLPWTPTFVRAASVVWSGWSLGAGAVARDGANAIAFSVAAPSSSNETLAQAIADNEFLRATIAPSGAALDLRRAEIRFSTRRIGFHAPLGYALFTSAGGFAEANAIYVSPEVEKGNFDEIEHVATLPTTPQFASLSAPLEIRIYAFGAQFDGHATSLTGFKLTSSTSPPAGKRRAARH